MLIVDGITWVHVAIVLLGIIALSADYVDLLGFTIVQVVLLLFLVVVVLYERRRART